MTVLVKTVLIFLEKTPLNKLISAVCELKQTVAFIYCLCVLISQSLNLVKPLRLTRFFCQFTKTL